MPHFLPQSRFLRELRASSTLVAVLVGAILLVPEAGLDARAGDDPAPRARPAAGVLASVLGDVKIERPGSGASLVGAIGVRLEPGDTVRVGGGSSATVYLAGGGIVRVPAESRIEIPREAAGQKSGPSGAVVSSGADPSGAALTAAMSSRSVEVLEAGLWILNDPQGSVLLTAMRGEGDGWDTGEGGGPLSLSPRYETVLGPRPNLVWTGDRPVRVVISRGKEVVWRSPPATAAPLTLPKSAPELRAGEVYRWWLEAPDDGAPLSEAVPFRVADRKAQTDATRFEKEVAALAGGPDGAALADLLRCGYYVQVGAWTRVIAAASDLLRRDPGSRAAERALDGSRQQMRLDTDAIPQLLASGAGAIDPR